MSEKDFAVEYPENAIHAGAADGEGVNGLEDTIPMMTSADYKERFKAEYYQLQIRIGKLTKMLSDWGSGVLGFQPACSYDQLEAQLNAMKTCAYLLRERADIEEIKL